MIMIIINSAFQSFGIGKRRGRGLSVRPIAVRPVCRWHSSTIAVAAFGAIVLWLYLYLVPFCKASHINTHTHTHTHTHTLKNGWCS